MRRRLKHILKNINVTWNNMRAINVTHVTDFKICYYSSSYSLYNRVPKLVHIFLGVCHKTSKSAF
jgi:uncharacterized phage-associated protein